MEWLNSLISGLVCLILVLILQPLLSHVRKRIAFRFPDLSRYDGLPALRVAPHWAFLALLAPCAVALPIAAFFWWRMILMNMDRFWDLHFLLIGFGLAVGAGLVVLSAYLLFAVAYIMKSRMWVFRDGILILEFRKKPRFQRWSDIDRVHKEIGYDYYAIVARDGSQFTFGMMWGSTAFLCVCFDRLLEESQWQEMKQSAVRDFPASNWQATCDFYERFMCGDVLAAHPAGEIEMARGVG
ncbi:MAG: hypothetical protein WC655_22900 [Candidatus Hydrogenedentales bacterium]|jgi:hypothetical protein